MPLPSVTFEDCVSPFSLVDVVGDAVVVVVVVVSVDGYALFEVEPVDPRASSRPKSSILRLSENSRESGFKDWLPFKMTSSRPLSLSSARVENASRPSGKNSAVASLPTSASIIQSLLMASESGDDAAAAAAAVMS